jgi:quercetin dioxygenase-like cupin family protein
MTQKIKLKDLVDYSQQNVNKQEAHRGKDFNVVIVCLERGQEIPVHYESYDTFFFLVSGKGIFTIGQEQLEMEEGDMVFSPAGERGIKALERMCILGVQQPH